MKPVLLKILSCLVILVVLSGCVKTAIPSATLTPSPVSSTPTLEASLEEPTFTLTPAVTPFTTTVITTMQGTSLPPIVVTRVIPTETATPEPTIRSDEFPNALIHIVEPGNLSQLASPLRVQAAVIPGAGNLVSLQVLGENGRLIHDHLLKMVVTESGWVNLVEDIEFEIPSAGEKATIVIVTKDEFGRRIAQSAVEVFLIQVGKSDIEDNDFKKQPFVVQTPKEEAVVKGGKLRVSGFANPFNTNPIIIELLTESGGVFLTEIVKLPRGTVQGEYFTFTADIPYKVDIRTPVRLTLRQRSLNLPNIDIALSSQLIFLDP